jgi:hypothetical protein
VWNRLILCLVLAGCGFRSAGPSGNGPGGLDGGGGPIDAASDGPGSGAGDGSGAATDCWSHWMGGSVAIDPSTVHEIMELSSAGDDRNPWISDDGLRMYFSRDLGPPHNGDIYFTSRTSPTATFMPPVLVMNLNTDGKEGRVTLTPDELTLAISTERGNPGHLQIDMETRNPGDMFGPPNATHLNAVNGVGTQRFDPFLTSDLLRLYFSADTGPSSKFQLLVATRTTATADFGTPALVPGINDSSTNEGDPTLYQNEQLLVFSAAKQDADICYATRSSMTGDFGTAITLPTVNTGADEFDPMLSHDGCELYFASDRDAGGKFHLFRAQVTP